MDENENRFEVISSKTSKMQILINQIQTDLESQYYYHFLAE